MKKNRIESKFKLGDYVEYIAKNSLYEHMWFKIKSRRITMGGSVRYRVSDEIIAFWAREQDLRRVNRYALRGNKNIPEDYLIKVIKEKL